MHNKSSLLLQAKPEPILSLFLETRGQTLELIYLSITCDLVAPDLVGPNVFRWDFLVICLWLRMPLIFWHHLHFQNLKGILLEVLNSFNYIAMFIWHREIKREIRYLEKNLECLNLVLTKLNYMLESKSIIL